MLTDYFTARKHHDAAGTFDAEPARLQETGIASTIRASTGYFGLAIGTSQVQPA